MKYLKFAFIFLLTGIFLVACQKEELEDMSLSYESPENLKIPTPFNMENIRQSYNRKSVLTSAILESEIGFRGITSSKCLTSQNVFPIWEESVLFDYAGENEMLATPFTTSHLGAEIPAPAGGKLLTYVNNQGALESKLLIYLPDDDGNSTVFNGQQTYTVEEFTGYLVIIDKHGEYNAISRVENGVYQHTETNIPDEFYALLSAPGGKGDADETSVLLRGPDCPTFGENWFRKLIDSVTGFFGDLFGNGGGGSSGEGSGNGFTFGSFGIFGGYTGGTFGTGEGGNGGGGSLGGEFDNGLFTITGFDLVIEEFIAQFLEAFPNPTYFQSEALHWYILRTLSPETNCNTSLESFVNNYTLIKENIDPAFLPDDEQVVEIACNSEHAEAIAEILDDPGDVPPNPCEWDLILSSFSYADCALFIRDNVGPATEMTEARFGYNGLNDCSDAFRHAFFNALNSMRCGVDMAREFGEAHECEVPDELILEEEMDLWNNEVGYSVITELGIITDNDELADIILSRLSESAGKYLTPLDGTSRIIPGVTELVSTQASCLP